MLDEPPSVLLLDVELVLEGVLTLCEPTFATPAELDELEELVLSIDPKARALKPELPLLPLPEPPASSALGGLGAVMVDVLVLFFCADRAASGELINPAPR